MTGHRHITAADIAGKLTWTRVADALLAGHRLARATVGDTLLNRSADALLTRSAWIDGLGIGVKAATVLPGNAASGLPSVHSAMMVFEDHTGQLEAVIDGAIVTDWKTTADSVLGARLLARPDSRRLLVVGAGTVAGNLVRAYREVFPGLEDVAVWNRSPDRARKLGEDLALEGIGVRLSTDLAGDAGAADIVATATMAKEPVLNGNWIGPGTHIDLIGAFTGDMREANNTLMAKGSLFVDSRETTIDHIGELTIPIAAGIIDRSDVKGDLYDLAADGAGPFGRRRHHRLQEWRRRPSRPDDRQGDHAGRRRILTDLRVSVRSQRGRQHDHRHHRQKAEDGKLPGILALLQTG